MLIERGKVVGEFGTYQLAIEAAKVHPGAFVTQGDSNEIGTCSGLDAQSGTTWKHGISASPQRGDPAGSANADLEQVSDDQPPVRMEAALSCYLCDSTIETQVHHVDGNHRNNAPINREVLCRRCHLMCHNVLDLPERSVLKLIRGRYDVLRTRLSRDEALFEAIRWSQREDPGHSDL